MGTAFAMDTLVKNCVAGLSVDEQRCRQNLQASTACATLLVPHVGYDRAADIAKEAISQGVPFANFVASTHPELAPLIQNPHFSRY